MSRSIMRLLLLFVITSAIALGGCTAIAPVAAPAGEAPAAGDEPVTIRFRSYTLGEVRDTALQNLITQFESEHPNIQVEVELPPATNIGTSCKPNMPVATPPTSPSTRWTGSSPAPAAACLLTSTR